MNCYKKALLKNNHLTCKFQKHRACFLLSLNEINNASKQRLKINNASKCPSIYCIDLTPPIVMNTISFIALSLMKNKTLHLRLYEAAKLRFEPRQISCTSSKRRPLSPKELYVRVVRLGRHNKSSHDWVQSKVQCGAPGLRSASTRTSDLGKNNPIMETALFCNAHPYITDSIQTRTGSVVLFSIHFTFGVVRLFSPSNRH